MAKNYVLSPAYAGVQFWNDDKSDLVEIRRSPGLGSTEIPADIPAKEAERLVSLGAIVEADKAEEEVAPQVGAPEEPAGNASRDEWAVYADKLGLTVEAGSGRDDIKKLVAESRA